MADETTTMPDGEVGVVTVKQTPQGYEATYKHSSAIDSTPMGAVYTLLKELGKIVWEAEGESPTTQAQLDALSATGTSSSAGTTPQALSSSTNSAPLSTPEAPTSKPEV